MGADFTVSAPNMSFDGYPFPFVRVHNQPQLGICAVLGYSKEGGALIYPDVIPVDADSYEVHPTGQEPFYVDVKQVYGVSWKDGK